MQNIETSSAMNETHKTVTRFELTKVERKWEHRSTETLHQPPTNNKSINEPIIEQQQQIK